MIRAFPPFHGQVMAHRTRWPLHQIDAGRRYSPSLTGARPMRLVALPLLLWGLFGPAVVVMMMYGVFDHVAMNDAVMAAMLAAGTALLASLASFLCWRAVRKSIGDPPRAISIRLGKAAIS
jgi:hypothetical protein